MPYTLNGQQNIAIWEMWRQGLHQLATLAEQHWEHGEQVERYDAIHASRFVWTLIEQANSRSSSGLAETRRRLVDQSFRSGVAELEQAAVELADLVKRGCDAVATTAQ